MAVGLFYLVFSFGGSLYTLRYTLKMTLWFIYNVYSESNLIFPGNCAAIATLILGTPKRVLQMSYIYEEVVKKLSEDKT